MRTKEEWINSITEACIEANTYKPFLDDIIESLAIIEEARDIAYDNWVKGGRKITITQKNKGDNKYSTKEPNLKACNELHQTALTYWKALGLTQGELKKQEATAQSAGSRNAPVDRALKTIEAKLRK